MKKRKFINIEKDSYKNSQSPKRREKSIKETQEWLRNDEHFDALEESAMLHKKAEILSLQIGETNKWIKKLKHNYTSTS